MTNPKNFREAEPVAWMDPRNQTCVSAGLRCRVGFQAFTIPLYASPPPATVANIPEGWVLVPKVATPSMEAAGFRNYIGWGKAFQVCWEAMLAASPNPNTEGSREHE